MTLLESPPHHAPPLLFAPQWHTVCSSSELESGWAVAALVGDRQVAIAVVGGEVFAVSHLDPMSGAPVMARGIVGSRRAEGEGHRPTITSPLLKQVYDLRTGRCYNDPDLMLECYPTRVVDGMVEVGVPM
ncbi:nitrite reductase small subunit NirD [Salinibacterium sp. dk2585]|uniref:nitrite reductase small subunit NirD n=1 Tax=unclassified Salinibacterium TaxID=2632331 RepID=UPI0011C25190|nr:MULTISPECIES: nitrite reductase small subunit NirD [unclassified Salinibacterium]QEE61615.1 nitrite reductase small subunit NirD [Salinibacterium sp. dk2585]TXK52300.1 nitrite reductase small subunit NirD [Salinibacterium sp. dk5596]